MAGPTIIVTLPSIKKPDLIEEILNHPMVYEVRYSTTADSPYNPFITLEALLARMQKTGKKIKLWLDLRCRQLRIETISYGKLSLNHKIKVELPAEVVFINGQRCAIIDVDGNEIFLTDIPPTVKVGHSINIRSEKLKIEDYLTNNDRAYIEAAGGLGITNFMLSFVESGDDIIEVEKALKDYRQECRLVLKIESLKGVEFARKINVNRNLLGRYTLLAARDDLIKNLGENKAEIIPILELIISKDPNAILASHIFLSLKLNETLSAADISDIAFLRMIGYKYFLFGDGIPNHYFQSAMKEWQQCKNIFG